MEGFFHRDVKGNGSSDTLISEFELPELRGNEVLLRQAPSVWCFAAAALGDRRSAGQWAVLGFRSCSACPPPGTPPAGSEILTA